jgi:putative transcriptional regulator
MRKMKSPILDAVRATAEGLHKAGVMDPVTLRDFDRRCMRPLKPRQAKPVKQIR